MKIKRLKIENFQSISKIEFNYDETGVFYYRGDNNIGKSSILKAINTLFFNASNLTYKSYIRDGEGSFYISMEDFNGNIVQLARGIEDFYVWTINGESGRYDRTSGRVPGELVDYFEMYYDEKTKECANIRLPRATLLGVDSTAGENNYLLQKALNSEMYTLAYKKADSKRKSIQKEVDLLFKYYDNVKENIQGMSLEEDARKISEMNNYKSVLESEYKKLESIEGMFSIIKDTLSYKKEFNNLTEAVELFDSYEEEFLKYEELEKLDNLFIKLSQLEESKVKVDDLVSHSNDTLSKIEDNIKELEEIEVLSKIVLDMLSKRKELKKLDNVDELDDEVIEELNRYDKVTECLNSYLRYNELLKDNENIGEELDNLLKEEKELEEELGYCPVCGNEFNREHSHK